MFGSLPFLLATQKPRGMNVFTTFSSATTGSWVSALNYYGKGRLKAFACKGSGGGGSVHKARITIDGTVVAAGSMAGSSAVFYYPSDDFFLCTTDTTQNLLTTGTHVLVNMEFQSHLQLELNQDVGSVVVIYYALEVE